MVLGLVVFAVIFVGVRALRHGADEAPPARYDERTRSAFLAACTQGAGAGSEPVCGCAYERLLASVPYRQYLAFEAQAKPRRAAATARSSATNGADTVIPGALEAILVDCIAANRALGTPPGTGAVPATPGSRPGSSPPGTMRLVPG